eukprot:g19815.t1
MEEPDREPELLLEASMQELEQRSEQLAADAAQLAGQKEPTSVLVDLATVRRAQQAFPASYRQWSGWQLTEVSSTISAPGGGRGGTGNGDATVFLDTDRATSFMLDKVPLERRTSNGSSKGEQQVRTLNIEAEHVMHDLNALGFYGLFDFLHVSRPMERVDSRHFDFNTHAPLIYVNFINPWVAKVFRTNVESGNMYAKTFSRVRFAAAQGFFAQVGNFAFFDVATSSSSSRSAGGGATTSTSGDHDQEVTTSELFAAGDGLDPNLTAIPRGRAGRWGRMRNSNLVPLIFKRTPAASEQEALHQRHEELPPPPFKVYAAQLDQKYDRGMLRLAMDLHESLFPLKSDRHHNPFSHKLAIPVPPPVVSAGNDLAKIGKMRLGIEVADPTAAGFEWDVGYGLAAKGSGAGAGVGKNTSKNSKSKSSSDKSPGSPSVEQQSAQLLSREQEEDQWRRKKQEDKVKKQLRTFYAESMVLRRELYLSGWQNRLESHSDFGYLLTSELLPSFHEQENPVNPYPSNMPAPPLGAGKSFRNWKELRADLNDLTSGDLRAPVPGQPRALIRSYAFYFVPALRVDAETASSSRVVQLKRFADTFATFGEQLTLPKAVPKGKKDAGRRDDQQPQKELSGSQLSVHTADRVTKITKQVQTDIARNAACCAGAARGKADEDCDWTDTKGPRRTRSRLSPCTTYSCR